MTGLEPEPEACERCAFGKAVGGRAGCRFVIAEAKVGATLAERDRIPPLVLYVRAGSVTSSYTDLQGRERRFSLRGPGSLLGWQTLNGHPADDDISVHVAGELCSIAPSALADWVEADGAAAAALAGCFLHELEMLACWRRLQSEPAAVRMARYLLGEATCVSAEFKNSTARSIARQLGLRHETFSRLVSRFAEEKLIVAPPNPQILDREGLRRVVLAGR